MKKAIIVVSAVAFLLSVNFAMARPPAPAEWPVSPTIQYILEWLENLQQQVNEIELIPGPPGEQGPPGPQGESGQDAQHGAGNVAFIHESAGYSYLLGLDGITYVPIIGGGSGCPDPSLDCFTTGSPGEPVPIPVEDIISWQRTSFLDKDGNFWLNHSSEWHNYGPLP